MSDLADKIMMEWKRVPCMPSQRHYDNAWANILARAEAENGNDAVKSALDIARKRYPRQVPQLR